MWSIGTLISWFCRRETPTQSTNVPVLVEQKCASCRRFMFKVLPAVWVAHPHPGPAPRAPPGLQGLQGHTEDNLGGSLVPSPVYFELYSDAREDSLIQFSCWPSLVAHAESSKKAFAMAWATFSTLFSFASGPASSRASLTQYCSVLGR